MFGVGLWTVDDDYRVVVNKKAFTEDGPELLKLAARDGKKLHFEPSAKMRPSLDYIRKHREKSKVA